MNLVFIGMAGSGKTTQGQLLAEEKKLEWISAGGLLKWEIDNKTEFGLSYAEDYKNGKLAPIEVTFNLIKTKIESLNGKGFVLEGYPRTKEQLDLLVAANIKIDKCVYLALPTGVAIARILGRQRSDDNEEAIRNRLKTFEDNLHPILEYYIKNKQFVRVDASKDKETVFASLKASVGLT